MKRSLFLFPGRRRSCIGSCWSDWLPFSQVWLVPRRFLHAAEDVTVTVLRLVVVLSIVTRVARLRTRSVVTVAKLIPVHRLVKPTPVHSPTIRTIKVSVRARKTGRPIIGTVRKEIAVL